MLHLRFARVCFAAAVVAMSATGQCAVSWTPASGVPGIAGSVLATVPWDPDGAGPAPIRVVVGGWFGVAGTVATFNLATYDPVASTWATLGSIGTNSGERVSAVVVMPNGDLVVGGTFATANGVPANNIARWDGTNWTALGGGTNGAVHALAVTAAGDLVAGGAFTNAGGIAANRIARWNGSAWSPLGSALGNGDVRSLAVLGNGDIVAGGGVGNVGGTWTGIATWNGASWSSLGSGVYGSVHAIAVLPNGNLVAAGSFHTAGGVFADSIARWDGNAWSAYAPGMYPFSIDALAVLPSGELVAGGDYVHVSSLHVARWNGSSWVPLGGGVDGPVTALATLPNGDLYVGGSFGLAGGAIAPRIARWSGGAWSTLGSGNGEPISALAPHPSGGCVAASNYQPYLGVTRARITHWSGGTSAELGTGEGAAVAIAVAPSGDVIVGGYFTAMGGVPANNIARWNGSSWHAMAGGHANEVRALAVASNGDVFAAGQYFVQRWDGSAWSALPGISGNVFVMTFLPGGDLVAGGANFVRRWTGSIWSSLGSFDGSVRSMAVARDGSLIVGGAFWFAGGVPVPGVARWNGTTWQPAGFGIVAGYQLATIDAMHVLPNGELFGAGNTVGPTWQASRVARWNGTDWTSVAAELGGRVSGLAFTNEGELVAGGNFLFAGNTVAAYLVAATSGCPATAQVAGTGCAGDTLTASLPWTGATWRSDASGLPNAAFVFTVTGFAPASLPLSAAFATALPGCTLHVQPDFVDLILAANGTAALRIALPNTMSLAGVTFHHQMIPFALDATLAVTATNSLQLTVGSF